MHDAHVARPRARHACLAIGLKDPERRRTDSFLPFMITRSTWPTCCGCVAACYVVFAVVVVVVNDRVSSEVTTVDVDVDVDVDDVGRRTSSCDRPSRDGDVLSIHYVGRLQSDPSVVIDFTRSDEVDGEPFVFQLGRRQVIVGLDRGLVGMCVGERRVVTVPSELAYGIPGYGERSPLDSDVVYDVELVDISDAPSEVDVFRLMDHDRDGHLSRQEVADHLRRQIPAAMLEANVDRQQFVDVNVAFDHDGRMVDEIFRHEDKDRNGFISHEEFSGSKSDEL